jgi:SAM-dependent methyltransferase
MPNPMLVRREKGILRHTAHQLLQVDTIRFVVARARYTWFVSIRHQMRTLDRRAAVAENTVMHNLQGVREVVVDRMSFLLRPLSVVETLAPDADLLVIGPRSEGELLLLLGYGFDRCHIFALDLISYSPWVELGDMHAMKYKSCSFDAVILGWVLAYSDEKPAVVREVLRTLRPGGIVAVGLEVNPKSDSEISEELGYLPGSRSRLRSSKEVLALFAPFVSEIIFDREIPGLPGEDAGNAVVIFRVGSPADGHDA